MAGRLGVGAFSEAVDTGGISRSGSSKFLEAGRPGYSPIQPTLSSLPLAPAGDQFPKTPQLPPTAPPIEDLCSST